MRWAALVFVVAVASFSLATAAEEAGPKARLFVVHFSTGSSWDPAKSPQEQDGFAEHSANLRALRAQGRIRFGARYDEFGMIVIDGSSLDAVSELIASDPGVMSGIFTFSVAPLSVFYDWKEPEAPDPDSS